MDVEDRLARGSRDIEWDQETSSAISRMIQQVQLEAGRPSWPTRRKLLFVLPLAALLIGGLTAGGVSIVNSLTYAPDAIVPISYTAADGSQVSCEVAVTATKGPAKEFIRTHDWSDVSGKVQRATAGPSSKSIIEIMVTSR